MIGAQVKWIKTFWITSCNKKAVGLLLLPILILKVTSLLISSTSKDSFQSFALYIIWSSEPGAQQLDIKVPTVEREGCFSPCLWQPQRDSWDRPRGPLALTLHREILSIGAALSSGLLMPRKCLLQHIRCFSSQSLEMGGEFKAVHLSKT